MTLDESNHRLFVGTRDPPKLIVFDTNSGKAVSVLDIANDADDIFYDAAKRRIYISCGDGFINIFQQQDANHYSALASVPTARGARTSLRTRATQFLRRSSTHRKSRIKNTRLSSMVIKQIFCKKAIPC